MAQSIRKRKNKSSKHKRKSKFSKDAKKSKPTNETEELRGSVIEVLRKLLDSGKNKEVIELVTKLNEHNKALERRITEILMRRRKGEGVSSSQLKLFLDALGEEEDATLEEANKELKEAAGLDKDKEGKAEDKPKKEKPPKQPSVRRPIPKNLRRVDNRIEVPEEERKCPECGSERECIGHDVTETIELIPAEVIVRVDKREKLACKSCEGEIVRAPAGDKIISGGKFGCNLVASILIDKYRDGLPLHRIKERLERLGLSVPISTLADQVRWATECLRPLWKGCIGAVLGSAVMQIDGTGLAVRDKKHLSNLNIGTLWGYVGDGKTALYLYTSTGKKQGQVEGEIGPEQMLNLRTGYVVADAANLFDASFKREELIECGCNMHARRYFIIALESGDTRAALAVGAFKKLYEIESKIRDCSKEEKLKVRQKESAPIYDKLVKWCKVYKANEPPSSRMYCAVRYLLNHEDALKRFLEDGIIPMDNGMVERLHIRVALTRKNFLFAGSDAGAERAAIAYTILGSCALLGIDPNEYLADVLPKLTKKIRLRDVVDFLPMNWKKAPEAKTVTEQPSE